MKMHEAIVALLLPENKDMWVRPVVWKGWQQAFCLNRNSTGMDLVPGRCGGDPWMTYHVRDLICDWEVVHSDVMLQGR